jgi:hypothetical protein
MFEEAAPMDDFRDVLASIDQCYPPKQKRRGP